MLPFNGQGGNQALEDAGALLALFSSLGGKDEDAVGERMRMFDAVRKNRASRQQIVSSVPAEEVKDLGEKLVEYEEEGAPGKAGEESMRERLLRELG